MKAIMKAIAYDKKAIAIILMIAMVLSIVSGAIIYSIKPVKAESLGEKIYNAYEKALEEFDYSGEMTQTPIYSLYDLDRNGIPELIIYSKKSQSKCAVKIYTYDDACRLLFSLLETRFTIHYPNDANGLLLSWDAPPSEDGFTVDLDRLSLVNNSIQEKNIENRFVSSREQRDDILTKYYGKNSIEQYDINDNTGLTFLLDSFVDYRDIYSATIKDAIDTFYDREGSEVRHSGSYFGDDVSLTIEEVGYCIKDLDNNGVPELLFGFLPIPSTTNRAVVSDLFTISSGKVVKLFSGWARNSFMLYSNSYFYNHGSGGANHNSDEIYTLNGGWSLVEGVSLDADKCYFYRDDPYVEVDGNYEIDPSKVTRISDEGWTNYVNRYKSEAIENQEDVSSWLTPLSDYKTDVGFDTDIFLANLYFDNGNNPVTNGVDPYKTSLQKHYENNPTNRFVKQLEADKSLNFWFGASDVMENTFDFDPTYGEKLNATFRDYFSTVLYSIIDISMTSDEVLEALDSKAEHNMISISESIFNSFDNASEEKLNIALKNHNLSTEDKQLLQGKVSKAVEEGTDISTTVTETLDVVDLLISSANSLYEIEQNVAKYNALYNMSAEVFSVLKAMRANCGDSEMIKVLDRMISCENDAEAAYIGLIKDNLGIAVTEIYNTAWPELRKAMLSALGSEVEALYSLFGSAVKGTSAICNVILGTDEIHEQYNKLMVIVMAEDLLYKANQYLGNVYSSNMEKTNARAFNQSVDMYFSLYSLECEYVKTFAKRIYTNRLFPKYESYNEWATSISNIKQSVEEYHDMMCTDWLSTLLEINYPELFGFTTSTRPYSTIIEKTRESIEQGEWRNKSVLDSFEMPFDVDEVGFAIKDFDDDGTPELVIAPYKNQTFDWTNNDNFVFSVYSIQNGKAVKLFDSYYRWNYYLYDGNRIVESGKDNGSRDSHINIYRIQDSQLYLTEGVRENLYSDYGMDDNYYHYTGSGTPIPYATEITGYGAEDSTYSFDEWGGVAVTNEKEIDASTNLAYKKQFFDLDKRTWDLLGSLQHLDAEFQVDKTELVLYPNQYSILRILKLPPGELRSDLNWESTNSSVATVNSFGVVTAVGSGSCEILIRTKDNMKLLRVKVIVSSNAKDETPSALDPQGGIIKGSDGKWAMYKDGKVDTTYTGVAKNEYGWWRVKDGYVDFNANGIYKNENGWWKTTNGKVTFKETGVFKNEYGWWRVENSKVNFKANGIYKNAYGWWKTTNGKVTFKETGIYKNEYGWWRVENSKVNFKANGIYKNPYGWWKTTNGKVTFKENGVFKNENGWWKVKNSKVDFKFTGIASNKNGKWYIKNGKVDFSKNGKVKYNGTTYSIKNGKVQ